jgi:putative ABC transport system substrate-binding protein
MDRRRFVAAMGSALAVPAAWAQQKLARIGVMEFGVPPDSSFVRAYLAGLAQLGYTDPANMRVERRYAQGSADRFDEMARDLVASKVALVFTVGNDIAQAAKKAAPGLTIVTAGSEDPVLSGLIADYRRPGGNVTGVTYLSPQLADKRLELLKEAVPGLAQVAVLWDPAHFDTYYRDMLPAALALGVKLQLVEARRAEEIEPAIAAARKAKADALFVIPSRLFNLSSRRIGDLALAARLPSMAAYANFTDAGGLMSYGAVAADMLQRAAAQTVKILGGAKAGDLPYERATSFELVINLKTARTLGVTIPKSVLLRADRVIE